MLLLVGVGHNKFLLKLQLLWRVAYSPSDCCESAGRRNRVGEEAFAAGCGSYVVTTSLPLTRFSSMSVWAWTMSSRV